MGACDFQSAAWGRTPDEAFSALVKRARWEHGHGGYTGTIAEKGSFVLYPLPPRVKVGKVLSLVNESMAESYLESAKERLAWLEASLVRTSTADKRTVRQAIKAQQAAIKREEKAFERFVRNAGPLLPIVRKVAVAWNDKWGPAVAFEVTIPSEVAAFARYTPKPKRGYRLFVFAGLASS